MTAGGSHRPQASGLPLGAAASGAASSAVPAPPEPPGTSSPPTHRASPSPSAGSLKDGGYVQVMVKVTGAGPLTTRLTVEPGNLTVMVIVKVKATES